MKSFYCNESAKTGTSIFKIPQLPSQTRKQNHTNTRSIYPPGPGTVNMEASSNPVDKIYEQVEVLKRIFPPEDKIWQDIVNSVNQFCFVKLRDQLCTFNSQGSIFNGGGSVCPSVHSQNVLDSLRVPRNNFTQSTTNQINPVREPAYGVRQPGFYYRPESPGIESSEEEEVEIELNYGHRKASNPRREPKRIAKRNVLNKSRKRLPPVIDCEEEETDENSDENDSTTSGLYVPIAISKSKESINSSKSTGRQPCQLKNAKTNESVMKRVSDEIRHEPKSKNTDKVLPSEDDSSMVGFLPKRRKIITKITSTGTSCTNNENLINKKMSVSLSRLPLLDELPTKKTLRSRSSSIKGTQRRCNETTLYPKPDSTQDAPKKEKKQTVSAAAKKTTTITASRKRATVSSTKPPNAEPKIQNNATKKKPGKKTVEAPTLPTANNNPNDNISGFKELSDNSFFGNVSSIDGITSSTLESAKEKNKKGNNANDEDLHFFSQFEDIRCTSGYSAISTPLSKSTAKNTLSKRLKKPSVAAELKDGLKKPRKPRKANIRETVEPINETRGTTESECEGSEFSDCD